MFIAKIILVFKSIEIKFPLSSIIEINFHYHPLKIPNTSKIHGCGKVIYRLKKRNYVKYAIIGLRGEFT
jgi:hypothetical protein